MAVMHFWRYTDGVKHRFKCNLSSDCGSFKGAMVKPSGAHGNWKVRCLDCGKTTEWLRLTRWYRR